MHTYVVSWPALEPARKKILKLLKSFNQIIQTLIRKSGVNIRVRNIIITRSAIQKYLWYIKQNTTVD